MQPRAGAATAARAGFVGYGSLDAVTGTLARVLEADEYLTGGRFSAADVHLGSQPGWAMQFGQVPARPALERYTARILARPAAVRARGLDDAPMPAAPVAPST
jgi:glutathione S-transferase